MLTLSNHTSNMHSHSRKEGIGHISMSMTERLFFRIGVLTYNHFYNQIENRIKCINYPITRLLPFSGKPILINSNVLDAKLAVSLFTGWIGHPVHDLACRVIKPYDSVLELGGTNLYLASCTALKTNPVSYHFSGDANEKILSQAEDNAALNGIHFKGFSSDSETTKDTFNLIHMRPYTTILINHMDMAIRLADSHIPLSLRHLVINTDGISKERQQQVLSRFVNHHFLEQSHKGKAIHLMRVKRLL